MGFLASIIGRVELDGSGFAKGAKSVENAATNMANNVANRFRNYLGAAALGLAIRRTVEYGSKINDLSARLNIGAEALQEFGYAAKINGSNLETFASMAERVSDARLDALSGNKTALDSFAKLGVIEDSLKAKTTEDIIKTIAETIRKGNSQELIGALRDVGGKGAGAMVSAFKNGLDDAAKEAREKGLIMGQDAVSQIDAIGDQFDLLGQTLTVGLAPALTFTAEKILTFIYLIKAEAARLGGFFSDKGASKAGGAFVQSDPRFVIGQMLGKLIQGSMPTKEDFKKLITTSLPFSGVGAAAAELSKNQPGQAAADAIYEDLAKALARLTSGIATERFDGLEKTEKEKKPTEFKSIKSNVDSLARIGGFVGGAEIALTTIAKETAKNTRETAVNTREIRDAMRNNKPQPIIYPRG